MGWRASEKPKGSETKAVKATNRYKQRQQTSVNIKGAVAVAVCVVGNRGGGRAAMLRDCVANVSGGSGVGRDVDHRLARICGTVAALQGVSHFLCCHQLAEELLLDFLSDQTFCSRLLPRQSLSTTAFAKMR